MMTAYSRNLDDPLGQPLAVGMALPADCTWLDLLQPSDAERRHVEAQFAIELPTRAEMKEIEASSQLYVENSTLFLTTPVIWRTETPHPEQGELSFILTGRHLITMRYADPRSFAIFAQRAQKQRDLVASAEDALLGLLDAVIDRLADVLELIAARINALSNRIFATGAASANSKQTLKSADLNEALAGIGRAGDLNHKLRGSLAGLERLAVFLASTTVARMHKEQKNALKTLSRDLRSVSQQAAAVTQEINFLLEATLGLINIEQNNIIKIFSVAAVAFLPPTLIASIYGMNFQAMPELDWGYGYPVALGLMVLSAVLPVLYFKRKGWL